MAQQIINVGATPNDGTGDPIRTAFIKSNNNFSQLYSRVQVTPPTSLIGQIGDEAGMYAYDSTYFYYCFAEYDGSSIIWAQVTQVGNISTNQINSGNSNVIISGSGGNVVMGINGVTNAAVFTSTTANLVGNVVAGGYFIGDGSLLTGLPASYANANVTAYAESGWGGNIVPSANATYNLGSPTNQWKSLYVSNTTIYLGNVPLGIGAGNVLTVDGNAVLTNGSNANISTTGNIEVGGILTDGYYFANGSPFVTPTSYGNANVVANLAALASNPISTSGNISGNYFIGDGSQLTNLPGGNATLPLANGTSNFDIATANGNVTITADTGNTWTFSTDGTLTFPGTPRIDTDANNFEVQAAESVNFEANAVVNIYTDTSGNAYQWQFGDDGNLTLPNGAVIRDTAGNAVAFGLGAGQASQGQFAVALGYGAGDTNQGNNSIIINATGATLDQTTANTFTVAPVRNDVANVGEVMFYNTSSKEITYGNTISVAGNITCGTLVGNVTGAGAGVPTISSTSNLVLSAVGNVVVTGGYLNMSGNISSTGNITGNYILGNGSQLSNVNAVTVDVTDTNGLTTIYYPTFVENRTTAQIARADVDLTYRTDENLLTVGNVSASGNVTGNYFIGNGSQLTDVAASVPSQTILPTIQSITVEARPAGLFGGGQGGANVTVANVIPVTEYGVIITDGTVSEKYKTGSLGSIPGTVSLTFTTGLNSAQFTVFAYVTSNAGTFYSNSAIGTSGICLLAGTQIALSDGTHKAIEHITYTDKLLSWDFDRGCYAETTAMWIKRGETGSQYNLLSFSDGTTLRTFDQHRIFNKQAGAFTYPMTDATPVGTITVNEHGQEITLINKQVIVDTIEYYNVITDYHMNLFSDSILTSCRFNNIYPITDMKFVKDSRPLRSRSEFHHIDDRFFHGLRLAEQTTDIETVEWYVNRLISTEVSTQPELIF